MELCPICEQEAPFKCTSCKLVNYCSAEHQKKHWPTHKVSCRPFKIERSDKLGRYLVATRDIPAKSILFVELPLVIGPKWCISDEEKLSPLFPCVGCFRSTPINGNRCPRYNFWELSLSTSINPHKSFNILNTIGVLCLRCVDVRGPCAVVIALAWVTLSCMVSNAVFWVHGPGPAHNVISERSSHFIVRIFC